MIARLIKHRYMSLGQLPLVGNTSLLDRELYLLRYIQTLSALKWSAKIDVVHQHYGEYFGVRSISTMVRTGAAVGDLNDR